MKLNLKKMIPLFLLAIVGLFAVSCEKDRDVVDNTVYSTVYDLNRSFTYNQTTGVGQIYEKFNKSLNNGDFVLMFIKADVTSDGSPIWAPMPRTEYIKVNNVQEEVDYDFDYSKYDFTAYVSGTYNISVTPQYLNNVTLRVILVPGTVGTSGKQATDLSKMSYNEVIQKYHIDDSKVIKL